MLLVLAALCSLLWSTANAAAPSCTATDAVNPSAVQGTRHASPLLGQTVTVEGIVTRVDGRSLFVQVRAVTCLQRTACIHQTSARQPLLLHPRLVVHVECNNMHVYVALIPSSALAHCCACTHLTYCDTCPGGWLSQLSTLCTMRRNAKRLQKHCAMAVATAAA